jgi:WD40 repeat protein
MAVFEVAIGRGGRPGRFRVEVIDSLAGHPSAVTGLDAGALSAQRRVLQLEVLASAALARGMPETEQLLRSTGQALFAGSLGADGIVGCYRASAALAAERGEDLRVVLRVNDPELAGLPWEAMFDREAGAYVCRREQLVRHVPVASAPAPLRARLPLRILGVVSSPSDLHRLDAAAEKENLHRALDGLVGQGLAEVHWAPDATWAGLQDMLMDGEWHVFHYIGHGSFDPSRDEGSLALEHEDSRASWTSAGRIVDLLRRGRPMPRLVVLNSCASAATGAGDLFSGTAAALVRGGVPAVAAMQYKITDSAAIAFARGFYAAIARGRGVDDAVSSGRVGILGLGDKTLEWVTPVLYLRGRETRLFTLPASTTGSSRGETGAEDTSTARRQPGGAVNPTAPEGNSPAEDRSVGHAAAYAPQHQASQNEPGPQPTGPGGPSRVVHTLTGHTIVVNRAAFSPDGTTLATASGDGTTRLWDVSSGAPGRALMCSGQDVTFSPDGTLLAIAGGGTAQLWEVSSGTRVWQASGTRIRRRENASPRCVAFSPDGTLLATGDLAGAVQLFDVSSGTAVQVMKGPSRVSGVAFSPDGTMLATAWLSVWAVAEKGGALLWETETGRQIRTLTGHADWVNGVAFSPDGTLLATASRDKTARLWDTATGEHLRAVTGHTSQKFGEVNGVAFSPDGTMLATASQDHTAQLWETATGEHIRTLPVPCTVNGVAFSPDGTLLATVGGNADEAAAMLWG